MNLLTSLWSQCQLSSGPGVTTIEPILHCKRCIVCMPQFITDCGQETLIYYLSFVAHKNILKCHLSEHWFTKMSM